MMLTLCRMSAYGIASMSDFDTDKDIESDSGFNHRTDASDMSEKADDDAYEEEEEEDISEFSESIDEKAAPLAGLKLTISEADVEAKPAEMPKNEGATKNAATATRSESDVVTGREGRVMSMVKDFNSGGRPIDSGAQPTRASPLRMAHAHSSDEVADSTASSNSKTRKNKDDKKTKKVKKDSVQRLKASIRRSASSPTPTPTPTPTPVPSSSSSAAGSTSLSSPTLTSAGSPSPSAALAAQAAIKVRQKRTLRVGEAVAGGEAPKPKCQTVRVPPAFDPLFYTAERIVHRYFSECYQVPHTHHRTHTHDTHHGRTWDPHWFSCRRPTVGANGHDQHL
jgi:hypothetical protein